MSSNWLGCPPRKRRLHTMAAGGMWTPMSPPSPPAATVEKKLRLSTPTDCDGACPADEGEVACDGLGMPLHDAKASRIPAAVLSAVADARSRDLLFGTPYPLHVPRSFLVTAFGGSHLPVGEIPLCAFLERWIPSLFSPSEWQLPPPLWAIVCGYGLTDLYRCLQCTQQSVIVSIRTNPPTAEPFELMRACTVDFPAAVPARCDGSNDCNGACAKVAEWQRGYQFPLTYQLRCTCGRPLVQFGCTNVSR